MPHMTKEKDTPLNKIGEREAKGHETGELRKQYASMDKEYFKPFGSWSLQVSHYPSQSL
jgi:hypothetical protein